MRGEKKELYSETVSLGNRAFVFDVKESVDGAEYLVISEVRKNKEHTTVRQVFVFEEQLNVFVAGLDRALGFFGVDTRRRSYNAPSQKEEYRKAYQPWTTEDEKELEDKFAEGMGVPELAELFERTPGAIEARLLVLGLIPD